MGKTLPAPEDELPIPRRPPTSDRPIELEGSTRGLGIGSWAWGIGERLRERTGTRTLIETAPSAATTGRSPVASRPTGAHSSRMTCI